MEVIWGWQHVDSYPDHHLAQGPVTEAAALAAFAEFPWDAQLAQLAQRQRQELTSTLPGVWFRRGPETLTLTAPSDACILLEYQVGLRKQFSQLSLSIWAMNLAPEEVIELFFAGELGQWPGWRSTQDFVVEPAPNVLHYASSRRSVWPALLPVIVVVGMAVLLAGISSIDWLTLLAWLAFGLAVVGPMTFLRWQYARAGRGQRVEVDVQHRRLRVHTGQELLEFGREQVRECVLVQGRPQSRTVGSFKHVAFVLTSGQVCVIPHETGPPAAIAQGLGVHYRVEESGFPRIYYRPLSAAELVAAQRRRQQKVIEFRGRFAAYTVAQLQAICNEPGRYASHAVTAATQLLQEHNHNQ